MSRGRKRTPKALHPCQKGPVFHLCQPGGGASCGACCGLYNFKDHSRAALTTALERHTTALADTPKTPESYSAIARSLKAQEQPPAFAEVRVCPLLGFVDTEHQRVGCLAHPKVTGGVDLRDCGVYDARLCEQFECPSFIWLTPSQAALIRAACPDWYLYGLIITDVELVRGVLRLIERELAQTVDAAAIHACPPALAAIGELFALKESAIGGRTHGTIFGRFAPDQHGEPGLRGLDYEGLGARAAPEDDVILCLGFDARSLSELESARSQVTKIVRRIVESLAAKGQSGEHN